MNLVGEKMKHKTFGVGTVVAQEETYITVQFPNESAKFNLITAFEKYLDVENLALHKAIIEWLEGYQQPTDPGPDPRIWDDSDPHLEFMGKNCILTYQEVEKKFSIQIRGFGRGINVTDDTVVLISAVKKSEGHFVYHDRWTFEGDYIYSGEGRRGDQTMTKGNLAIFNAARDGRKIHLLIKYSPQDYRYQGIYQLVDYRYEDEEDEYGDLRKEYKFRLRAEQ